MDLHLHLALGRQCYERRVWLLERDGNIYSETCFDVETGEVTGGGPKTGPLTDQSLHSRGSKALTVSLGICAMRPAIGRELRCLPSQPSVRSHRAPHVTGR